MVSSFTLSSCTFNPTSRWNSLKKCQIMSAYLSLPKTLQRFPMPLTMKAYMAISTSTSTPSYLSNPVSCSFPLCSSSAPDMPSTVCSQCLGMLFPQRVTWVVYPSPSGLCSKGIFSLRLSNLLKIAAPLPLYHLSPLFCCVCVFFFSIVQLAFCKELLRNVVWVGCLAEGTRAQALLAKL